jgi:glycerophosphoryl diester phosphodiesterase
LTLTELRKITEVLTLEELLDLASKTNREVLVETKHPVMTSGRAEKIVIDFAQRYKFTAMSFSLLAVLRFKKKLNDVAYVVSHRWRLLYMPTKKVAVDVELFAKSPWVRKRLARKEVLLWTVNEEKFVSLAKQAGVAALITDNPEKFIFLR